MKPVRIQRLRSKGWEMPAGTVYVGRPGKWGNPFNLASAAHCWTAIAHGYKGHAKGRRLASVTMFSAWIRGGKAASSAGCGLYAFDGEKKHVVSVSPEIEAGVPPSLEEIRAELGGKNLACWCEIGEPCHADVLLEIANEKLP